MATMPNTNINIPYSAFLDPITGRPTQAWLLWLMSPSFINVTLGSALPVTSGGTGLTSIPTNGQLLIGNGTGYTLNTLGYGAGISVNNGSGTITVANTGVLSNLAGSGISVSNPTGNVTIGNTGVLSIIAGSGISASSPTGNVTVANTGVLSFSGGSTGLTPATATTGAITLAGTLAIASGGTNGTATPTAYGVAYGTGTAYAFTAAGTAKQVLIANTSAAPTWSTLTSGTSILYGDGSGGFSNVTIGSGVSFAGGTLSATGSGGTVTSVTGTSPVVSSGGTTPAISLATAYGDTLNPYASKTANYVLAAPSGSAGVPTFRALTTADLPALPYGTGTVTSVALALPSIMAVSGSPVTTSGTLTGALTTQSVNSIFAGPSSGAAAAPTFRALTTADIPALAYGSVTSVSFTGGIVSVATPTTTPALTVAGTSGGVPYFSSGTTWASSAALAANAIVLGGGAGAGPATTTTGTGVVTALGVNTGTAGAFVVNGGALGTPSSGTVTNLTGTASININGTVGATTPAAGTFTSLSDSGNLTFTGTGNRITGDFSNGTVANRLMLQTSTANSASRVGVLPNGTSAAAELLVLNNSDTTNAGFGSIRMNASDFQISATYNGAGTYLPMTFYTGGSERVRINTSGSVGIGTSSPAAKLDVAGEIRSTGGTVQTFIEGSSGNGGYIGTRSNDYLQFRTNNADVMRIATGGIVTMSAYGAGAATFSAAGVISSVSDETWKIKDGVPVDPDSMLKKLEPGYWYYNDEKKEIFGVDRQLGFYAQNVNAAIGPEAAPTPETVISKAEDGTDIVTTKPWGYYDRSVLAVTVMSLQKALATIESLTARITALESTVMKDTHDNINSTI